MPFCGLVTGEACFVLRLDRCAVDETTYFFESLTMIRTPDARCRRSCACAAKSRAHARSSPGQIPLLGPPGPEQQEAQRLVVEAQNPSAPAVKREAEEDWGVTALTLCLTSLKDSGSRWASKGKCLRRPSREVDRDHQPYHPFIFSRRSNYEAECL
jgi:hypothetical protein